MRENWGAACQHVLAVEGGYVHHSADKGGPTNHGLSQAFLQEFLRRPVETEEVRQVNPSIAASIYEQAFWRPLRCDDLPGGVDLTVLDAAVHAGQGQATRWLQQAVNADRAGDVVKVDGVLGSKTLVALAACPPPNLCRQVAYYRILEAFDDPEDTHFARGWVDRILRTFLASVFIIASRPPCAFPGESEV